MLNCFDKRWQSISKATKPNQTKLAECKLPLLTHWHHQFGAWNVPICPWWWILKLLPVFSPCPVFISPNSSNKQNTQISCAAESYITLQSKSYWYTPVPLTHHTTRNKAKKALAIYCSAAQKAINPMSLPGYGTRPDLKLACFQVYSSITVFQKYRWRRVWVNRLQDLLHQRVLCLNSLFAQGEIRCTFSKVFSMDFMLGKK